MKISIFFTKKLVKKIKNWEKRKFMKFFLIHKNMVTGFLSKWYLFLILSFI